MANEATSYSKLYGIPHLEQEMVALVYKYHSALIPQSHGTTGALWAAVPLGYYGLRYHWGTMGCGTTGALWAAVPLG